MKSLLDLARFRADFETIDSNELVLLIGSDFVNVWAVSNRSDIEIPRAKITQLLVLIIILVKPNDTTEGDLITKKMFQAVI